MNIVEQVARVIDPEAFADCDVKPWPLVGLTISQAMVDDVEKSRRTLHRGASVLKAVAILKLAGGHQDALVEYEIEGWRRLGIPVATLESIDTIRRKYVP